MSKGIISRTMVAAGVSACALLAGTVGTSVAQPASEQETCTAHAAGDAYAVICHDYLKPESQGRFSGEVRVKYLAPGSLPQIEVEGRVYDLPANGKRQTYLATTVRNRVCTTTLSRCSAWTAVPRPS
ncbi:hypothetical protein [Amycolatopsis sp. NPDC059657]|uniref:hypothetical protein n=1 Tax=Amycolatopsis sp. NPDC059657 TaxID=3346899 RepID=UPI00366B5135